MSSEDQPTRAIENVDEIAQQVATAAEAPAAADATLPQITIVNDDDAEDDEDETPEANKVDFRFETEQPTAKNFGKMMLGLKKQMSHLAMGSKTDAPAEGGRRRSFMPNLGGKGAVDTAVKDEFGKLFDGMDIKIQIGSGKLRVDGYKLGKLVQNWTNLALTTLSAPTFMMNAAIKSVVINHAIEVESMLSHLSEASKATPDQLSNYLADVYKMSSWQNEAQTLPDFDSKLCVLPAGVKALRSVRRTNSKRNLTGSQ
ncbi:hypothetical protein BC830DRAFT_1208266 [Chytriomyces sp. MP71]|nr:hypothetical protein BC830DRAFT_1208266 [Chytriomyces sp. MP71]